MANKYKIDIKTGDVRGAGTDATVTIILHGHGKRTDRLVIEDTKGTYFEQNQLDTFTLESPLDAADIDRIEFWRDNLGWFSSWFVDYIEVTPLKSGITSIFPVNRWIEADQHYVINHLDTFLPQDDPFKQERAMELKAMQQKYQYRINMPGGPAQIKELPQDEQFSFHYAFNIQYKRQVYATVSEKEIKTKGLQWQSIEDVKNVYVEPFPKPESAAYFNDDLSFGRQRTSGINYDTIKLCKEIPDKFGASEEELKPFLEGKSLKDVINDNRLFIVDQEFVAGMPTKKPDLFVPSPIGLFYFNDEKKLMPIAIQLYQQKGPENPVFFPSDDANTWCLAKLWFNLADAHYHQALTHLNYTHFMMEGTDIALKRQISPKHPVHRMLGPHFLYLLAIDYLGLSTLVSPGGIFDQSSNGGLVGALHLISKSNEKQSWRLDLEGTLPEKLKRNEILDPSILPEAYPYRDDGMLLFNAINTYVTKYVNHYYASDEVVSTDHEIQAWGAELNRSKDEGGVGLAGVPNGGKFETRKHLIDTLVPIIFTCSVEHAASNMPQYDQYAAPLNYPFILYGKPPTVKSPVTEEFLLKTIGNRLDTLAIMATGSVLSDKATQSLGDYEKQWIVDPPALAILEEFRKELDVVEKTINERNQKRDAKYEYLIPSHVSNAISI